MASRYEQPISQAPSNVYVITDRGYPPVRRTYRFWQQTATAGYRREAEVAGSVFNALNDTHKEHPLGDLIGSRVMGWLTVTL